MLRSIMTGTMPPWLEQAWLDRYLERGLDEDESAWFEAYVLDKPKLLAQIEADTDLRDAAVVADWPPAKSVVTGATAIVPERRERRGGRHLRPWWALAAGLVAGVALTLLLPSSQGGLGIGASEVLQPPRLIYDAWRGAGYQLREEAGDADSPLVLVEVALPAGLQPRQVQVEIEGIGMRSLDSVRVSADGFLSYLLPSPWLGRSRLHIRFDAGDTSVPDLVIDLDRTAGGDPG